MAQEKVNLSHKFALFTDHANPRIAGELNDSYVKLVKLKGEFVWHHHENEDELFLIVKGQLIMKLRDRDVVLNEGEFFIVPKASSTSLWRRKKCMSCCSNQNRP